MVSSVQMLQSALECFTQLIRGHAVCRAVDISNAFRLHVPDTVGNKEKGEKWSGSMGIGVLCRSGCP